MTSALSNHLAISIRRGPNSVDAEYSAFSGGTPTTVTGRFVKPALQILGVQSNGVEFHCMLEDVPNPRQGDRYTIEGVRYRVREKPGIDGVAEIVYNLLELVP